MVSYQHIDAMASRVQKRVASGLVTDEERVNLGVIRHELHKARAFMLGNLWRNRFSIPLAYYQKLCCLKVVCRDVICDGEKSGEVEHVMAIPSLIGKTGTSSLRYVGSLDGSIIFRIQQGSVDLNKHFPFSTKADPTPVAKLVNNRELILQNLPSPNLTYLCIEGLFSDPEDPLIEECGPQDTYPIPGDELMEMEDLVYKGVLEFYRKRVDVANDAKPIEQ